jgi:VanZ family protein
MKNIKNAYAPALVWGIFIFVLSILPGKDFPTIPDWGDLLAIDKIIHIAFYGLLAGLILRGKYKTQMPISPLFALFVIVFSSSMGWFLEWIQGTFCEDRMADVMDGIANTIGAILGLIFFFLFQRKKRVFNNA